MRREYVETISSHAAPSPARHLLTSSAPSPTVTAFATPTSRPFQVPPRRGHEATRVGGQPIVKRALRPPGGESSAAPRAEPRRVSMPGRAPCTPAVYYSLTMLHYILWRLTREVKP